MHSPVSWLAQNGEAVTCQEKTLITAESFGVRSKYLEAFGFFVIFVLPCILACVWGGITASNAKPTIAGVSLMFMTVHKPCSTKTPTVTLLILICLPPFQNLRSFS